MDNPTRLVLADVARAQRLRLLDSRMETLGRHSGERRVRTAEGSKKFGLPIGELIRKKLRRKKDREQDQQTSPGPDTTPDAPAQDERDRPDSTGESRSDEQRMPPPAEELFGYSDEELRDRLAADLNGRYGRVMDMQIERAAVVDRDTPQARVVTEAYITNSETGEVVGEAIWEHYHDENGALVAHHELLAVSEDDGGRNKRSGLASAFVTRMGAWHAASDVDRVTVYASMENGGAVWANFGFEFDTNPRKLGKSITSIRARMLEERASASPSDQALIDSMVGRLDASRTNPALMPSPRQLMGMAGDNPGLGSQIMNGASWTGAIHRR